MTPTRLHRVKHVHTKKWLSGHRNVNYQRSYLNHFIELKVIFADPYSLSLINFDIFVLIDASGSHLEVAMLTTKNLVFFRIFTILLCYKNHTLDYLIKFLQMDYALEFKSHAFEDYCTTSIITLTYSAPYEHSQNGLTEAFIKNLQIIFRLLFNHAKLPNLF